MPKPKSPLAVAVVALGVAVVLAGLSAQLLGYGRGRGFWGRQALLVLLGMTIAAGGALLEPRWRAAIRAAWQRAPRVGLGGCVLLGAWLGLVVGFFEVAHTNLQHALDHKVYNQSPDQLWIVPFSYLVGFAALGALCGLGLRGLRLPFVAFVMLLLAVWSQFLAHPTFDGGAVNLLTVALAWKLASSGPVRGGGIVRFAGCTLPVLLLALGVCLLRPWWEGFQARRAVAALPAAADGAPNVLLVVLDTVCADHLEAYGYQRATAPRLAELAQQGVTFELPLSNSPWTLPAHVALFTGLWRFQNQAGYERALEDGPPTLAEVLAARGYATGGFVGNIGYASRNWGIARGFHHYADFPATPSWVALTSLLGNFATNVAVGARFTEDTRNDAKTVTDGFLTWVEQLEGRPWFGFLNYFDAHAPYQPPEGYSGRFGEEPEDVWTEYRPNAAELSDASIQRFVNAYDALIGVIDDQLARVLDRLAETGALADTLVVVVGDHGEHFGEHGLMGHANSLYRPLVEVPLLLHWPRGVPAGVRYSEAVTIRDVPATILQLLGVEGTPVPGQSLARFWDEAQRARSAETSPSPILVEVDKGIRRPAFEPTSRGDMKALVVDDRLYYILNGDGVEELYDLRADPEEERDLSAEPEHAAVLERARAELRRVLGPDRAAALPAGK